MTHAGSIRRVVGCVGVAALLWVCTGCTWMTQFGSSDQGAENGKTFFVGGAGAIGAVAGTFDVPSGLKKAGYRGAIEVFGWQSYVGDALRDQVDKERNLQEAKRLAERIAEYMKGHPGCPVNVIALSAGTGIATWALEALPPSERVESVVLLSSSLARDYDMTEALKRVRSRLYCFYSEGDPVLSVFMRGVGSVDRSTLVGEAAGLKGLTIPAKATLQSQSLYRMLVRNIAYHSEWARYGYYGMHADSVSEEFIRNIVARLVMGAPPSEELGAVQPEVVQDATPSPTTLPSRRPSNLDIRVGP